MKNNNIIQEVDYKRIKKIEEIREKYFNELPDNKNNTPIASFLRVLGLFLFVSIFLSHIVIEKSSNAMLISLATKYDSLSVYIFVFAGITAFFSGTIAKKEKKKRISKVEDVELNVAFFVNKLKDTNLDIPEEDFKYYKIFLNRYINYYILKEKDLLDNSPSKYFNKRYVSSLTVEELFVSAFVYPSYSSFIYIDTSGGD
jgi:hypothetical protein